MQREGGDFLLVDPIVCSPLMFRDLPAVNCAEVRMVASSSNQQSLSLVDKGHVFGGTNLVLTPYGDDRSNERHSIHCDHRHFPTLQLAEGRSYRWVARDLDISKNTVADIAKLANQKVVRRWVLGQTPTNLAAERIGIMKQAACGGQNKICSPRHVKAERRVNVTLREGFFREAAMA